MWWHPYISAQGKRQFKCDRSSPLRRLDFGSGAVKQAGQSLRANVTLFLSDRDLRGVYEKVRRLDKKLTRLGSHVFSRRAVTS